MKSYKVIHIPYIRINPYQKLLLDNLKLFGLWVEGIAGEEINNFFPLLDILTKKWKPDIIHLHWHHRFLVASNQIKTVIRSVSFLLQLLILKILGTKMIWTLHNLRNHRAKYQRLEIFFSIILANIVDMIIAHCDSAKDEIEKVLYIKKKSKIAVIPHGNYINYYKNTVSRDKAREKFDIPASDVVFLFFGLIRPYKGVLGLIESFNQLNRRGVKLVIAGKPLDSHIEKILRDNSQNNGNMKVFPEFIPDNEVQTYMRAADVVVFPFQNIFTSGSIILAMSFGRAIIAPRIGCIPDILDSSGSILFEPNKEKALLHAMEKAVSLRDYLENMGNHNLELVKKLDSKDIAETTYEAYKRCLGI